MSARGVLRRGQSSEQVREWPMPHTRDRARKHDSARVHLSFSPRGPNDYGPNCKYFHVDSVDDTYGSLGYTLAPPRPPARV